MRRGLPIPTGAAAIQHGLTVIVSLVTLWLVAAVTVAGTLRSSLPQTVLDIAPWDAGAKAQHAGLLLGDARNKSVLLPAGKLLRSAIRRDATSVPAVRTLGLVEELSGHHKRATALFDYSQKLSRRDLGTQLWLLDSAVRDEDIPGALHHYDVALRTSTAARRILFPILVGASEDPVIAAPFAEVLRTRPNWTDAFVAELVYKGKSLPAVVRLSVPLLNPGDLEDREALRILAARLVGEGEFNLAWQVFRRLTGEATGQILLVRNPGFEKRNEIPPFDWMLVDEPSLSATPQLAEGAGDNFILLLNAGGGRGGEVARQLLKLPPGAFVLSFQAGEVPSDKLDRPVIRLRCASESKSELIEISPGKSGGSETTARFSVPASGCAYQWLSILLPGGIERREAVWVDDINIRADVRR